MCRNRKRRQMRGLYTQNTHKSSIVFELVIGEAMIYGEIKTVVAVLISCVKTDRECGFAGHAEERFKARPLPEIEKDIYDYRTYRAKTFERPCRRHFDNAVEAAKQGGHFIVAFAGEESQLGAGKSVA